jgi:hypothetical protein
MSYRISLAVKDGTAVITGQSGNLPADMAWMISGFLGSETPVNTVGVTITIGPAKKNIGMGPV